jgi:hypothetical protein
MCHSKFSVCDDHVSLEFHCHSVSTITQIPLTLKFRCHLISIAIRTEILPKVHSHSSSWAAVARFCKDNSGYTQSQPSPVISLHVHMWGSWNARREEEPYTSLQDIPWTHATLGFCRRMRMASWKTGWVDIDKENSAGVETIWSVRSVPCIHLLFHAGDKFMKKLETCIARVSMLRTCSQNYNIFKNIWCLR